jgi:hypothetical protein
MKSLRAVVAAVLATALMSLGMAVHADQHEGAVKANPVEFWSCNFNDGKDMKDLDKPIAAFNKWAGQNNDEYVAWVMTPNTFGPGESIDVGWLGAWPDGNAYGRQQDAWAATGQRVFQDFNGVVTCNAHEMATSLPINAPDEPPGDGVVLFSKCNVAEGKTFNDAIAAHRSISARMGKGSGANSWLFFPGSGSAQEGSASTYWLVLGFDNYTELGSAWEMYTNGGGYQQALDTLGGVTDCSGTTTWNARLVSN